MLDAALSFISGQVAEYTVAGHIHRQFGNLSSTGKVTGNRFKAGEGDLMLAVMTERQFDNLMKGLGREDALADPRFADLPSRSKNEPALRAICIEDALASDSAKNWETASDQDGRAVRRHLDDRRDRPSPPARASRRDNAEGRVARTAN